MRNARIKNNSFLDIFKGIIENFQDVYINKGLKSALFKIIVTLIFVSLSWSVLFGTLSFGLMLLASLASSLILAPFVLNIVSITSIIGTIGFLILELVLWSLFFIILNLERVVLKAFIHWFKTDRLNLYEVKEAINIKNLKYIKNMLDLKLKTIR